MERTDTNNEDQCMQGNMPNELQVALLKYARAKKQLITALESSDSDQWKHAIPLILNPGLDSSLK